MTTRRITAVEQLTDEVVRKEIVSLLRRAKGHVANKKAKLILGSDFKVSDDELLEGPMGRSLARIFQHVRFGSDDDPMEVAQTCEEVLEFLWASEFSPSYQIPDAFWDTPLGFAIYEVVGRTTELSDSKELTSTQAAKFLGISQPYLHRLTREGTLPVYRLVGTHSRYRVGDLKRAKAQLGRRR
jgi:excisionase family DNA binding protein